MAPQFRLHLVHDRTEAEHVGDIDAEADGVPQRRFMLRKAWRTGLRRRQSSVGGRINAAHAGDEQEITGTGGEVPGAGRLDGSSSREHLDPSGRRLLRAGQQSSEAIATKVAVRRSMLSLPWIIDVTYWQESSCRRRHGSRVCGISRKRDIQTRWPQRRADGDFGGCRLSLHLDDLRSDVCVTASRQYDR